MDEKDKHLFIGPQWYKSWMRIVERQRQDSWYIGKLGYSSHVGSLNFPYPRKNLAIFISHWNILHKLDIGEPIIPDDEL